MSTVLDRKVENEKTDVSIERLNQMYDLAVNHHQSGDLILALSVLDQIFQEDSDFRDVPIRKKYIEEEIEDARARALTLCERVADQPNDHVSLSDLADLQVHIGQQDKALANWASAAASDENHVAKHAKKMLARYS